MNSTANSTSLDLQWAIDLTEIINNYVIRITGGVGALANLLFVVLLLNKNLKHKIYDFFWCRSICNLLVCVLAAGYVSNCYDCESESYWFLFYQWHINFIGIRILSLSCFISDIFLIVNRYLQIIRKQNFFSKMSKTLTLFICFSLPILVCVPFYFIYDIVLVPNTNKFTIQLNHFGSSTISFYYLIVLFLIENVIPIFISIGLSISSVYKYKILMVSHGNLTNQQIKAKEAEQRFTNMIIILSIICLTTRIFDLVASLLNRLSILRPGMFSINFITLIRLLKGLSNFVLVFIDFLDCSVYIVMDKNIWKLISNFLGIQVSNVKFV